MRDPARSLRTQPPSRQVENSGASTCTDLLHMLSCPRLLSRRHRATLCGGSWAPRWRARIPGLSRNTSRRWFQCGTQRPGGRLEMGARKHRGVRRGPRKVTAFGESAGGCSIANHLTASFATNPLTPPLFDAAVFESAGASFGFMLNWTAVYGTVAASGCPQPAART
ncbi:hypothetical protein DFJ73DRAFT_875864 [Zopfochytrium polystomum]|nr:hypothetical protein DFJ73DRAFT_875864 [Zopfochytrium polystomum]